MFIVDSGSDPQLGGGAGVLKNTSKLTKSPTFKYSFIELGLRGPFTDQRSLLLDPLQNPGYGPGPLYGQCEMDTKQNSVKTSGLNITRHNNSKLTSIVFQIWCVLSIDTSN